MDQIDAMKVFIAVLDEGSLTGASRRLRRSPAAVSRSVAYLEAHVGVALLHRTTRSLKLSEAGERYAVACRKVMLDLNEAERAVAQERPTPFGALHLTAPTSFGEDILLPILKLFSNRYPEIRVNLMLTDHPVNLVEENIDVALRFGRLTYSSFIGIRLGEVRKIVVASPLYLASRPRIDTPAALSREQIIALADFGLSSWEFPPSGGSRIPRIVCFSPRLVVNTARAAIALAIEGHGVARLFSCHADSSIRSGKLTMLLPAEEAPSLPVHLVTPKTRLMTTTVRAFVDFVTPTLRAYFAGLQNGKENSVIRLSAWQVEHNIERTSVTLSG